MHGSDFLTFDIVTWIIDIFSNVSRWYISVSVMVYINLIQDNQMVSRNVWIFWQDGLIAHLYIYISVKHYILWPDFMLAPFKNGYFWW